MQSFCIVRRLLTVLLEKVHGSANYIEHCCLLQEGLFRQSERYEVAISHSQNKQTRIMCIFYPLGMGSEKQCCSLHEGFQFPIIK